jgi:guanine deaminase
MSCLEHRAAERASVATSRRSFIAGFASSAVLPATALAQADAPASGEDLRFMRMALEEARRGDFPFGAVIVRDGAVIARPQPRAHGPRPYRPRRDGRDPPLSCRPRS